MATEGDPNEVRQRGNAFQTSPEIHSFGSVTHDSSALFVPGPDPQVPPESSSGAPPPASQPARRAGGGGATVHPAPSQVSDAVPGTDTKLWCSGRLYIALLFLAILGTNSVTRSVLPLGLLHMTGGNRANGTSPFKCKSKMAPTPTPAFENSSAQITPVVSSGGYGELDFDHDTIGWILFWAHFSAFLGPWSVNLLRRRVGNKLALLSGQVLCILTASLVPWSARYSQFGLIMVVLMNGVCVFSSYPVSANSITWWAPVSEKLKLVTLEFIGLPIATGFIVFFGGLFCNYEYFGWPVIFYYCGALSFVSAVVWVTLGSTSPEQNRFVSKEEIRHIVASRVVLTEDDRETLSLRDVYHSGPKMMYLFASTINAFVYVIVVNYLPFFLVRFLEYSYASAGPYMAVLIILPTIASYVWVNNCRNVKFGTYFAHSKFRKFNLVYLPLMPAFFFTLMYASNFSFVLHLFGFITYFITFSTVGQITTKELPGILAPTGPDTLQGWLQFLSSVISFAGPSVGSALTKGNCDHDWAQLWYLCAGLLALMSLLFLTCGCMCPELWTTRCPTSDTTSSSRSPPPPPAPASSVSTIAASTRRGTGISGNSPPDYRTITRGPCTNLAFASDNFDDMSEIFDDMSEGAFSELHRGEVVSMTSSISGTGTGTVVASTTADTTSATESAAEEGSATTSNNPVPEEGTSSEVPREEENPNPQSTAEEIDVAAITTATDATTSKTDDEKAASAEDISTTANPDPESKDESSADAEVKGDDEQRETSPETAPANSEESTI